jgi:hypothetical protein
MLKISPAFQSKRNTPKKISVKENQSRRVDLLTEPIQHQILGKKATWCLQRSLFMPIGWHHSLCPIHSLEASIRNFPSEEKSTALRPAEPQSNWKCQTLWDALTQDTLPLPFCHFWWASMRGRVKVHCFPFLSKSLLCSSAVLSPWQPPANPKWSPAKGLIVLISCRPQKCKFGPRSPYCNCYWKEVLDFINTQSFIQQVFLYGSHWVRYRWAVLIQ